MYWCGKTNTTTRPLKLNVFFKIQRSLQKHTPHHQGITYCHYYHFLNKQNKILITAPRSFTPTCAVIDHLFHTCRSPRLRSNASLGRMCQTFVDHHTCHWSLTPAMIVSPFVRASLCPHILWSRALVSRVIACFCLFCCCYCHCYCHWCCHCCCYCHCCCHCHCCQKKEKNWKSASTITWRPPKPRKPKSIRRGV